jgi:hypothetical protein
MKKPCCVLALMLILLGAVGDGRAASATLTVYGNSLAAGWQNWSWNTTANFSNTTPVYPGNKDSLAVTYTGAWGGLFLAAESPLAASPYNTLQFYIHGGTQGGQKLSVVLYDTNYKALAQTVALQASAGKWTQVTILLSALGSPATIGGIVLQDTTGGAQPTFYLDDICLISQAPPPPGSTLTVYGNSLAAGWQDWSWSATRNFSNTNPVYPGNSDSLAVTITGAWGGLFLAATQAVAASPYDTLQFYIHGGTSGGQKLNVILTDNNHKFGQGVPVQANAGQWTQVNIPLSSLASPSWIGGIILEDTTGNAQPIFYLDNISFINQGLAPPPTLTGPALSINVSANRHAISPNIYGINYADQNLAAALNLPVRRWGGNSTTRYNWQHNIHNTGSDWYFENIPDGADVTDGSASDLFIEQDRSTGTKTLMTVPLIGWTPRSDSPRNQPYDCGFEISKYGTQQSTDQYDPNCGNGVLNSTAKDVAGNNPLDTSTAINPAFVTQWVDYLVGKFGTASKGGVAFYDLDNEPMLWNSTHRDVHPKPTSYAEMETQTSLYAAAVKAADPTAETLGPALWGWCAYFFSAVDGCSAGTDYTSHGKTYFVPWYLQQMHAHEKAKGVRILDFLDFHYYPAATGVSLSQWGGSSTQALRLRSTRSLWDPTYTDESWIGGMTPGGAVNLIPRMKAWVAANYPGTKLAISEYNWGALNDINGALAQADVLGIFGSQGLDLATLWGSPADTDPGAFAFRMYRNYDGAKHAFGDVSTQAASADQGKLAVYAAQRTADKALTVMVINKIANPQTSTVTLAGYKPASKAAVYRYSPANVTAIAQPAGLAVSAKFSATFPGNSITLFVMTPSP